MTITAAQVKAARLLLGWDLPKMAAETHFSSKTIAAFEQGKRRVSAATIAEIRYVLEQAGVEFLTEHGGHGVKVREAK